MVGCAAQRKRWMSVEMAAANMGIRELAAIVARQQDGRADLLDRMTEALRQLTEHRTLLQRWLANHEPCYSATGCDLCTDTRSALGLE